MAKGLYRVIAHWAVTKYKCDETSKKHYHFIFEGDGNMVVGFHTPEANINTADGVYAAHTLGCNNGSIGVSCAAMFGAVDTKRYGNYPITKAQFDAMCRGIALLCDKYGIAVTPKTVLSHAEVQANLGVPQRGKWDIAVLPHVGIVGAKECGDYMRKNVQAYLDSLNAQVATAMKFVATGGAGPVTSEVADNQPKPKEKTMSDTNAMNGTKGALSSVGVWGGIVAVLAGIIGVFGYAVSPEDINTLANSAQQIYLAVSGIAGVFGGLVAIWGRIRASKKIG